MIFSQQQRGVVYPEDGQAGTSGASSVFEACGEGTMADLDGGNAKQGESEQAAGLADERLRDMTEGKHVRFATAAAFRATVGAFEVKAPATANIEAEANVEAVAAATERGEGVGVGEAATVGGDAPTALVLPLAGLSLPESASLGRGLLGEVFSVSLRGGARVAVKRLLGRREVPAVGGGALLLREGAEELRKELAAMAALRHPNLVQLLGWGGGALEPCDARGRGASSPLCLVSELLPCSLWALLEGPQPALLALPEVLSVMRDVCCALAFLHGQPQRVVHGAISSRNVLLCGNVAKLADLGHAALFRRVGGSSSSGSGKALDPSSPLGRASMYAAPELSPEFRGQALRLGMEERADLFAVGVLAVQMAAGEPPSESREQQLRTAAKRLRPLEALLSALTSFLPR